jgi:hypothetical protein
MIINEANSDMDSCGTNPVKSNTPQVRHFNITFYLVHCYRFGGYSSASLNTVSSDSSVFLQIPEFLCVKCAFLSAWRANRTDSDYEQNGKWG